MRHFKSCRNPEQLPTKTSDKTSDTENLIKDVCTYYAIRVSKTAQELEKSLLPVTKEIPKVKKTVSVVR
jgi:hypothetical protein